MCSASKSFNELQGLIQETIEATRTVSFSLAPSVLSDFGVVPAIRILTEQVSKVKNMTFNIQAEKISRLPEAIETCLYRITQEAIHNTTKYAKADLINIQLFDNERFTKLLISDDGEGFDLKLVKKHGLFL